MASQGSAAFGTCWDDRLPPPPPQQLAPGRQNWNRPPPLSCDIWWTMLEQTLAPSSAPPHPPYKLPLSAVSNRDSKCLLVLIDSVHGTAKTQFISIHTGTFLADRFAICLFCRNSIKYETSSVKRDFPLSEVLLPITIMDLIGNWKFKYSHASHLAPYMVVT